MLSRYEQREAFRSVHHFIEKSGDPSDNCYMVVNAFVKHGDREYHYRGIEMNISYDHKYEDFQVAYAGSKLHLDRLKSYTLTA